jgi:Domain of unknown function DUF29
MARNSKSTSSEMIESDLYEQDYYAWIQNQIKAMRERRIKDIDWDNVAEEIEDLGKSEKRSIESRIARIVEHLLKLAYAPGRTKTLNRRGWELSIREARRQIRRRLSESPSLRRKTPQMLPHGYAGGRNAALIALNLPDSALPESSPWTLEQVLDDSFLPDRAANSERNYK